MNAITRIIKRWLIYGFTGNPYRLMKFDDVYRFKPGRPLDQAESASGVLYLEKGALLSYVQPAVCLNGEIKQRRMGDRPRYLMTGVFKEPDRILYSVGKAGIIGQLGLVYDIEKRTFIDESAKEWVTDLQYSSYASGFALPVRNRLPGMTLSFLTIGAEAGFYHFLFESVSKLALYRDLLDGAGHYLFNGPQVAWKLKWLHRAGVDTSKIIWMEGYSHFECEQIIFSSRVITDQQISHWCLNALKTIFDVAPKPAGNPRELKMIFITRKGLDKREIIWENELLARFPEIQVVDFSSLGADETIELLIKASHVIGPHGAGLSNIYLCRPGTKVLEIYPEQVTYQPCYQRICDLNGLGYYMAYLDFENKDHQAMGLASGIKILSDFLC